MHDIRSWVNRLGRLKATSFFSNLTLPPETSHANPDFDVVKDAFLHSDTCDDPVSVTPRLASYSGEFVVVPIPSHHRSGWIPAVGPAAATGFWEKVELLPWTLMHPQPPLGELFSTEAGSSWQRVANGRDDSPYC